MVKELLFRLAKSPSMGKVVGDAFRHCPWAIPVKKVRCSREVLAFCHPKPAYAAHLILSPRRAIRNLQQMAAPACAGYFACIWDTAMDICAHQTEYREAFTLVANGGRRQEVQQVHFHLFTGYDMVRPCPPPAKNTLVPHPQPGWAVHYVISADFPDVLRCIDRLDAEFGIVQRGYALVYQHDCRAEVPACPVFHIIAGKRYP